MKIHIYFILGLFILSINNLSGKDISENQINFLKNHSINIPINNFTSDSIFDEIKSRINDKKIILIGEPNHGSKEVFLLRNSLIKYLNKNLGFDVILFESGIGELIYPNIYKNTLSSVQMTYGFFGGWRTDEFSELMEYVKQKKYVNFWV